MFRILTLAATLACISLTATAQDKIYTRNLKVIEAKVQSVDKKTVTYKKFANLDGPDYVISKRMVGRIEYENGTEDRVVRGTNKVIHTEKRKVYTAADYGNSIISISPVSVGGEGIGVGLAYEQMLDKKGRFSVFVPFHVSYSGYGKSNNDAEPLSTLDAYNIFQRIAQFSPGVKFYPTGNRGKVRYAVGAQLNYQDGFYKTGGYERYGRGRVIYTPPDNVRLRKTGLMLNNSINLFPTPHIYIGADLGLGATVYNQEEIPYTNTLTKRGTDGLIQVSFRIGIRL